MRLSRIGLGMAMASMGMMMVDGGDASSYR